MTFKKLFKKLQQEQFDVEGYDVVFDAGDPEDMPEIECVNVDHENKRVIFSTQEPVDTVDGEAL